ncbi:DegQ family serine endoprotease [uncultured Rhodospira sp.]|uniref:DegQ family serine endoprotease n=1 Tax=uncultured Rhodospira sp. TaxID=1936189 RepID=UPI0026027D81|nr:DegQ family serine endoprotease [uncultured Rhodospira sp.]
MSRQIPAPSAARVLPGQESPRRAAIRRIVATLVVLTALVLAITPALAQSRPAPDGFADMAERLLPSVVNISTTQTVSAERGPSIPNFPEGSPFRDFFEEFFDNHGRPMPGPRQATSLGSGFIIDESGYIVTNTHVIADADEVTVTLFDDTALKAEIVGRDPKTDIALLKVEPDRDLPAVPWGDSDASRVGDWVVAIGNPFGLGGSVTAGIISARARDINAGPYDNFIQTDASINRGNSGGPLFNLDGQVIGINTAIFSPSGGSVGIGFAVPANLAKQVISDLKEYGRTRRGWLGVRIQTVTPEIAESLGMEDARGALVASVTNDGPAQEAGLRAGDVILSFNDRDIDEMRQLPRIVAETEVGATVPVEIWRDGDLTNVKVELGELEAAEDQGLLASETPHPGMPGGESEGGGADVLGMTLQPLTPDLAREFGLSESAGGVVITSVGPDSDAARKGLEPGHVIVEVNQTPVSSVGDVQTALDQAREAGRTSVLMLVQRDEAMSFLALKLG